MAGYGSDSYGRMPYGSFTYIFVPGSFKNPSFEIGSHIVGEAVNWVSESVTNTPISGFDVYENSTELFQWTTYTESSSWTSGIYANGDTYDNFLWGNPIVTFSTVPDATDDFNWFTFIPIFVPVTVALFDSTEVYEDFQWTVYSPTFVVDTDAMFDSGTTQYEDFGAW